MYYFAYAADLDRKLMESQCPGCKARFSANLPNYKLIFSGWSKQWNGGMASIKTYRGDHVSGAVYEVTDAHIRKLDNLYGYPSLFDRIKVTVWDDTGKSTEAFTYIKKQQGDESKPSPELMSRIKQGYRDWDID